MSNKSPKPNYQVGPDKTRLQAVFTRAGRDHLGRDAIAADPNISPVDVRRVGLGRLAMKGTALVVGGAIAVGGMYAGLRYTEHQEGAVDRTAGTQVSRLQGQINANEHNPNPIDTQPTQAETRHDSAEVGIPIDQP